jgi:hypothetical protein
MHHPINIGAVSHNINGLEECALLLQLFRFPSAFSCNSYGRGVTKTYFKTITTAHLTVSALGFTIDYHDIHHH